jgi:small nuclear ribonucleoprotein (snRNP)-like protein
MGFDEYMNIVLDDAQEIYNTKAERTSLGAFVGARRGPARARLTRSLPAGRILLKGDTITLMAQA